MTDDTLWTSYANAMRAGSEVDALMGALDELLIDELGEQRIDERTRDDQGLDEEQDWVESYGLVSHEIVLKRGRSPKRGRIEYAVSLWRKEDERGTAWMGARQSKLYVAYVPPKAEGWFPDTLLVDGNGESPEARPMSTRRWTSNRSGLMAGAWFFCVRLLALQSREDLMREVVNPLRLMMRGVDEDLAFANASATLGPSESEFGTG